ncbi:hypothetical protein OE88DRAFT_1738114 [Heliocybe sulcata]|uniref:C2H2-type domain-containing protein n=1 Tax=Heliocybe sulcata TaxID=5364 RepID=A0A5C3MSG5_9AGAM|nr:hypothetical protein OE88DRAFT_1738114 [Heliocybe sulcata]
MDTFWDSYQKEMSNLGLGTALWQPSPPTDARTGQYLYKQIEIGDVGIRRAGAFHRLFNIFLARDHEHQTRGTPRDFEPLVIPELRSADDLLNAIAPMTGPLGPGPLHSESVQCRSFNVEAEGTLLLPTPAVKLEFTCKKRSGAALVLPNRAERYDALPDKLMKNYMIAHYSDWLEFAEGLGMDVELEDLHLITGCDRCDQWAMAVFRHVESERAASASITIPKAATVSASFKFKWDAATSVLHHYGPYRREMPRSYVQSPSEEESFRDQTVFIRGFSMKKRAKWIPPKVMRASVGHHNIDFDPDDDGCSGISFDGMSISSDEEPEAIRDTAKDRNPLSDLLDSILDLCPEADAAIAHDYDIRSYSQGKRDLMDNRGSSSGTIIVDNGVAYLGARETLTGTTISDAQKSPIGTSWSGQTVLSLPSALSHGCLATQCKKGNEPSSVRSDSVRDSLVADAESDRTPSRSTDTGDHSNTASASSTLRSRLQSSKKAMGVAPFTCGICGIGFTRKGNLAGHMSGHYSREPSYRCDYYGCTEAFTFHTDLERHCRTHREAPLPQRQSE